MEGVDEIVNAKASYESQNPTHLVLITNALELSQTQVRMAAAEGVILLLGDAISHYGEALRARTG